MQEHVTFAPRLRPASIMPLVTPVALAFAVASGLLFGSGLPGHAQNVPAGQAAPEGESQAALGPGSATASANMLQSSAGPMAVQAVVTGLKAPWAFGFLPDGGLLITERDGRLLMVKDGQSHEIGGLPKTRDLGQGGLLDVMVPRDFAQSRRIWLSWSGETDAGLATMAGRGRLSEDGLQLEGMTTLFTGTPAPASRHFGARLVEATDGSIFLTTGERGTGPGGQQAQDPANTLGKVVQLTADGTAGAALASGWAAGVYSLGHRNMQGAALAADGSLLVVDHGARGGDEINRVAPGRNYGWPVISYGVNYNGSKIGSGQTAEGMEQPLHYWDPSIAPSGLLVYSGRLVPQWRGNVFTGSLKSDFIARLEPQTPAATGWAEERLQSEQTLRVRDLREGPDGAIWFLSEGNGTLYRLAPARAK